MTTLQPEMAVIQPVTNNGFNPRKIGFIHGTTKLKNPPQLAQNKVYTNYIQFGCVHATATPKKIEK